jgi:hypothetical protein
MAISPPPVRKAGTRGESEGEPCGPSLELMDPQ